MTLSVAQPPLDLTTECPQGIVRKSCRVVGLFAGIGGIELGLSRAGHISTVLCEKDEAAKAILGKRFPEIEIRGDVRQFGELPDDTDLVAAGFPCQDLSQAGKTAGLDGDNSSLILNVLELVERNDVPWLLLENVPFMLQLQRGKALNAIVTALESSGFKWAYRVIDTRAFGLPQRRERVYLLASRTNDPGKFLYRDDAFNPGAGTHRTPASYGFYWTEGTRGLGWAINAIPTLKGGSTIGIPSAPAVWLPSGVIGTPHLEDAERLQGFEPGWTEPAALVGRESYRWKLIGNAVSVPAAEYLGSLLTLPEPEGEVVCSKLEQGAAWPKAAFGSASGRYQALVSQFPVSAPYQPIEDFLSHPLRPLSVRAATGFLRRAKASSLKFVPGFLEAIEHHIQKASAN